jgi:hypothetical protein
VLDFRVSERQLERLKLLFVFADAFGQEEISGNHFADKDKRFTY